ncbi:hypothetical protein GMORB2_2194 [Geosmithia morbida]|uniref:Mg2+ transporter protein, CorA-like/Zinc transport protein ZntB n=1 Tax=Geosmithia morbida TaxID=1094350 RepID=A0A9P5D049_9HYPO|nr:uncharacterized protein GMORB2_2194 [Geosmithia morbida]KAF4121232.1 hypothetical protein GMORB2_2194 [Geosmithia morbida]
MDEYMFHSFVEDSIEVEESTSYLEILNYSSDAQHPKTFDPQIISLPKDVYKDMVQVMKLPYKGIETSAVVGPFFWSVMDGDDDGKGPHLKIIHRKSDVRKKGKTRGWEMMLSHSLKTGLTTGYIKGTPSSSVAKALRQAVACAHEVSHPMFLPVLMLGYDLGTTNDQKQRDARDWIRRLENAVSMRDEVHESETYFQDGFLEIDGLSRDLVECHGHVMWRRPQAYTAVCAEMDVAMDAFSRTRTAMLSSFPREEEEEEEAARNAAVSRIHHSLSSRIRFYKVKLKGLESYIHTTLARLKVQREALYNIMSQREARLNLEIAREQRRIAHSSKRDSTAMKTLSLLGAVFLPGTYLASFFDMPFFNFEQRANPVSTELWVYFVVTIPVTALIIVAWLIYERRREAQHRRDDIDLERSIDKLEKDIMLHMRTKTMSKAHTWNTATQPPPA